MKMCMTLSHGQASVERSFSENKLVVTDGRTRLSEVTLHGLRMTSSFVKRYDNKPERIPINSRMLNAVCNARANYFKRMQAQKSSNEASAQLVAPVSTTSLVDVRRREDATAMQAEGMKMLQDGIAKKDMSKVSAANVLLSKSSEMLQQVNGDVPKK